MRLPDVTWSHPPRAAVGGIDVVYLDLNAGAREERAALTWLDATERARRNRLRGPSTRREFALCRAALRHHLCKRLACSNDRLAFGATQYGKPFAMLNERPSPYAFSVSHSGAHGLIALSPGGAVGIDVEERLVRADLDGMAAQVFGPNERAALAKVGSQRKLYMFYRLWTIKEALFKALGTGFSHGRTRPEIPSAMLVGARSGLVWTELDHATRWFLQDLGEARFAAALAHEGKLAGLHVGQ